MGETPPTLDFQTHDLAPGVRLHLRRTEGFATARVDVFIRHPLRRRRNTAVALLSRLLERGTRRLPDLLSLNRFLDDLFGASFAVAADKVGPWQVLHLFVDAVEKQYTPTGSDPVPTALAFLGEVLHEPALAGDGFPEAILEQERSALAQVIAAYNGDRTAWAMRRCHEEMCRGQSCALPAHGDPRDLGDLGGVELLDLHRQALASRPVDIYICTSAAEAEILTLAREHLLSDRASPCEMALVEPSWPSPPAPRVLMERQHVQQGRMVLGYRTGIGLADPDWVPLMLLNTILGGDMHSRLYRTIREELGLAYHVGTSVDPLCGLFYVEAGIDPSAQQRTRECAIAELADLGDCGPDADELSRARKMALSRLTLLADDRDGLTRFAYGRLVARADPSRAALLERLHRAEPDDIARAARSLRLDTAYFMAPVPAAAAGAT